MRKISLMLVAVMLLSASSVVANDSTTIEPTKKISKQIGKLLEKNSFNDLKADLTAKVLFTVNTDREIVVLSVDTKDASVEAFVKRRLNYKKIDIKNFRKGKRYTIPVRIKN
ncbi:MAG: hypothetical protein V3U92_18810 [Cellulophaga sp.]